MINRKLLVLAASRYQVPVIMHAKAMGCRVVTTDNIPGNPGHALADCSYGVDTTDLQGVLGIAEKEKIDGVIAACTDAALPAAAHVAEVLGLSGIPSRSALICCDKIAFRSFLRDISLPVPRVHTFTSAAVPGEEVFGNRMVMKPDRSSGSKGVFIVESRREFLLRLEECLSFSPSGRGILESCIEGYQGTCEGVIHGGRVVWHLVTDRKTAAPPFVATYGHLVPAGLGGEAIAELIGMIGKICLHLMIDSSVFDCDFIWDGERIFILEFTPRLGGNSLTDLVRYACGFDIVDYAICQALDLPLPGIPDSRDILPSAVVLLGVPQEGILQYEEKAIPGLKSEPWVKKLEMDYRPGEKALGFTNGRNRTGEAILSAESRSALEEHIGELKARLRLRTV